MTVLSAEFKQQVGLLYSDNDDVMELLGNEDVTALSVRFHSDLSGREITDKDIAIALDGRDESKITELYGKATSNVILAELCRSLESVGQAAFDSRKEEAAHTVLEK